MRTFDAFDQAYQAMLATVVHEPDFHNAPRGYASREKLGMNFMIRQPIQRGVYSSVRKSNIVFNFAEALWYLSGRNDLAMMQYYNKRMPDYSMDGTTLTGTAYGEKLFHFGQAGVNQWENVVATLRQDPDSKRAVLQIFAAQELGIADNCDVSCTLGLQFLIREGQLHLVAYMRANDVFRGMVSDIFSFTMIQEMMAHELGLPVGSYFHQVGTLHLYEPDATWATHVLADKSITAPTFPAMPSGNNWPMLKQVMQLEAVLREDSGQMDWAAILATGLPPYWQQVVALLSLYQMIAYQRPIDQALLSHLWPIYRNMFAQKWPRQIIAGEQCE